MRILRLAVPLLLAVAAVAIPTAPRAQVVVGVSIRIAPPALPVYVQPAIPGPGFIWTPGYWRYGPAGYFWVPGTWVRPPTVGLLWTPGYWGWRNGLYIWNAGYWGPHVGFYGGVNYGFGYTGVGFFGGRWVGGVFSYNAAVWNVGHGVVVNSYHQTIVNNVTVNRVSYNGGPGGLNARPTAAQEAAAHERHVPPTAAQQQHVRIASRNPQLRASVNHGHPAIAATQRPGNFKSGVVRANAAGNRPGTNRPAARPGTRPGTRPGAHPAAHPGARPAARPAAHPGARPAARPGMRPGARPAAHPQARPAAHPARPAATRSPPRKEP